MKYLLSHSLLILRLLLLMVTSSLWASNPILEDKEAPTSYSQATLQVPLSKEEQKVHLLAQKINQHSSISCDENNLDHKIYIPNEIMFLIMDNMEPQVFGTFLTISQSSFELARGYLLNKRKAFTKVISSEAGIEAYRKSCLLGTLPYVEFRLYDGKGLPEEARTALYFLTMKDDVLANKDTTFLSHLINLHTLNIEYNDINENVTALAGLTSLHTLDLDDNNLGEHLSILTSLSNLRTLLVGRNSLGEHVTVLTGLTNLYILNLRDNNLGEHVTALSSLTKLHTLDIGNNNIDEHIAALFENLTNIKRLEF